MTAGQSRLTGSRCTASHGRAASGATSTFLPLSLSLSRQGGGATAEHGAVCLTRGGGPACRSLAQPCALPPSAVPLGGFSGAPLCTRRRAQFGTAPLLRRARCAGPSPSALRKTPAGRPEPAGRPGPGPLRRGPSPLPIRRGLAKGRAGGPTFWTRGQTVGVDSFGPAVQYFDPRSNGRGRFFLTSGQMFDQRSNGRGRFFLTSGQTVGGGAADVHRPGPRAAHAPDRAPPVRPPLPLPNV